MKKIIDVSFTFLEVFSNGIWVGALVTLGIAVAGIIFKNSGSINLAGELNARVIARVHFIELACAALLFLSILYAFFFRDKDLFFFFRLGFCSVMISVMCYYVFVLMPELEHFRLNVIKDFDNFNTALQSKRDYYNVLHQRYTWLVKIVLFSGLANLITHVIALSSKSQ